MPVEQIDEDTDSDATFTVVRSAGAFGEVSVDWQIIRKGASTDPVNLDITPFSGTVTFASQEREKVILLDIIQDTDPEPAEEFTIRLVKGTETNGAEIRGISEGTIIIEDSDDVYGVVEFADDSEQKLVIVSIVI